PSPQESPPSRRSERNSSTRSSTWPAAESRALRRSISSTTTCASSIRRPSPDGLRSLIYVCCESAAECGERVLQRFLFNRKLRSLLNKNAPLWMRTPRLRKLVADATALRRECAQERTLCCKPGERHLCREWAGEKELAEGAGRDKIEEQYDERGDGVNSNLATAIRTMVVVVMAWGMVFLTH